MVKLVKHSVAAGRIGQIFSGGSRDWSNVLWEYLALAKLSMSVCGIGSGVKLPVGVDRIG